MLFVRVGTLAACPGVAGLSSVQLLIPCHESISSWAGKGTALRDSFVPRQTNPTLGCA